MFSEPYAYMKPTDFIAELEFLPSEKSGRKSPAHSGYRPHIEFENYPEYLTSGQQVYIGQHTAEPGTKVNAEITILGAEYFAKRIYENMAFTFCEGANTIGFGKVLEIINPDLRCTADADQKSINLNLYAEDIKHKLRADFGEKYPEAFRSMQRFIISDNAFQNPRIIRAVIYLANKNILQLEKTIQQARTDWRDILLWAEYQEENGQTIQVRDFTNEF
ncbi:protein chain elongation factor EF-Tu [Cytophaga hutchinsonii ATCC 33406]|uniref:Protein chain elongation factor EF-Tu n=2 Tax=Cytophaga hutchinsonii TaxID=985 RepID=A0A6N4SNL6_CYTH3|nr:protein chain elongation factor EF-Tu [Cytophaga hutchinsonii ATCC 33406]SFX07753.1 hypothetical protein SAMN04487930_101422 [Cytophaga hutchinsonii ATCC 33406]